MKAIIYTSATGHTERYAKMLSEKTGIPAYPAKEAKSALPRGSEIYDSREVIRAIRAP